MFVSAFNNCSVIGNVVLANTFDVVEPLPCLVDETVECLYRLPLSAPSRSSSQIGQLPLRHDVVQYLLFVRRQFSFGSSGARCPLLTSGNSMLARSAISWRPSTTLSSPVNSTCLPSSSRGTTPPTHRASSPGYRYVVRARPRTISQISNNHGGICVFARSHFLVRHVSLPNYNTFEVLLLTVRHGALNAMILTLYRPGSQSITDDSFKELGDVLERCSKSTRSAILLVM